jgi:hypothetical protein
MACRTRACMAGLTPYALRSTLDTAAVETAARFATSAIVTRRVTPGASELISPPV